MMTARRFLLKTSKSVRLKVTIPILRFKPSSIRDCSQIEKSALNQADDQTRLESFDAMKTKEAKMLQPVCGMSLLGTEKRTT